MYHLLFRCLFDRKLSNASEQVEHETAQLLLYTQHVFAAVYSKLVICIVFYERYAMPWTANILQYTSHMHTTHPSISPSKGLCMEEHSLYIYNLPHGGLGLESTPEANVKKTPK